jgi:hypothetical protein
MAEPTSYPSWAYHPTEPAVVVQHAEAFAALPTDTGDWQDTPYPPPSPVVMALEPSSVALGMPSFTIHVTGEGFSPDAVIVWNGYDEPTTVVSPTEVTTGVNMDVWQAPATVPVCVRNGNGTLSNERSFAFLAASRASEPEHKTSRRKNHSGD